MAINYKPVGWDTTKYVNPTNMNQMDNGIKAACDGVDTLTIGLSTETSNRESAVDDLLSQINTANSNLETAFCFKGNIDALGITDIATAPMGIYSHGAVSNNYNIPNYCTIFKPLQGNFSGSFLISRQAGENQSRMYIYDVYLGKFRQLAFA